MRFILGFLLVLSVSSISCQKKGSEGKSSMPSSSSPAVRGAPAAKIKRYEMRGVVERVTQDQSAVIKHEDIKGWMEAMTMEYPIRDKSEFSRLSAGEKIRATVFVQGEDYWIGEIQMLP